MRISQKDLPIKNWCKKFKKSEYQINRTIFSIAELVRSVDKRTVNLGGGVGKTTTFSENSVKEFEIALYAKYTLSLRMQQIHAAAVANNGSLIGAKLDREMAGLKNLETTTKELLEALNRVAKLCSDLSLIVGGRQ